MRCRSNILAKAASADDSGLKRTRSKPTCRRVLRTFVLLLIKIIESLRILGLTSRSNGAAAPETSASLALWHATVVESHPVGLGPRAEKKERQDGALQGHETDSPPQMIFQK